MAETDPREAARRLKAAQEAALRRSIGDPLPLSDAALDQAAEYRLDEQEAVYDHARRNLSPELRDLVDAKVIEPDA